MEQLIFIGIVLVFSIIEASARKRKQQAGESGEIPPMPLPSPRPAPRGSVDPFPHRTYDDDAIAEFGMESAGPRASTSEGLVPAEVWDEIARLARAKQGPLAPTPSAPRPVQSPPMRSEPSIQQAQIHPVHTTHPNMGKPMAERHYTPPPAYKGRPVSEDVSAVRSMLAGGAPALRRAVILEEVLGPPASMRGDPFEPFG